MLQFCSMFLIAVDTVIVIVKKCRFTMTSMKRRKRQKFVYRIFACKISCYHQATISSTSDII